MQKYLEDHHGPVTILLSADGRRERKGFLVDGHTPLYSIARIPQAAMDGRASINAYKFFERKLRDFVYDKLEEYIENYAVDMSIYSEDGFWADALHLAGIHSLPRVMVLYYEIQSGLLHFIIGGRLSGITYDVVKGECLLRYKGFEVENTGPYALLDEYFGPGRRNQLLAEHQLSNNLAPQPFAQIAAVNAFLSDRKREVYAVFKGRSDVKLKADNGRYHLGTLIEARGDGFYLRGLPEHRLHELVGIRYRHTVFPVCGRLFCSENRFLPTGTGD